MIPLKRHYLKALQDSAMNNRYKFNTTDDTIINLNYTSIIPTKTKTLIRSDKEYPVKRQDLEQACFPHMNLPIS